MTKATLDIDEGTLAKVASVARLGAPVLYAEGLSHDQVCGAVKVVNAFRQD